MEVIYTGEKDTRIFKDIISNTIQRLTSEDEDVIYLDADVMSCINTLKWSKTHKDKAIDCGIAEANMAGMAAGLAAVGFKPIIHSFGPFASRRCFDQVFMSAGYAQNDITIIGTDAGVCAALNGGTHMPFEDMSLMRSIPNATVIDISDTVLMEDVFPKLVYRKGVKYMRTGRKDSVKLYAPGSTFEIGKGNVLCDGTDVTIVACGIMTAKAMEAAIRLKEEGISAAVIDMFTVKPIDGELLEEFAAKTGAVVAAENHSSNGGLTEAVARSLMETKPVPMEHVAIDERFGQVGPQSFLEEEYGLTTAHIIEAAKKAISRK